MVAIVNPVIAGVNANSIVPIIQQNGSVATPLATISSSTGATFTLPVVPTIPAGTLSAHTRLRAAFTVQRTGANGTANLDCYLGTLGTVSDSRIIRVTYAATTLQVIDLDVTSIFTSTTTVTTSLGKYATNSAGVDNQYGDFNTNINTAATMKVTLGISSSNTLDSFALIQYRVWVELL